MKEQIEEMARKLCDNCAGNESPCRVAKSGRMCGVVLREAETIYTAGYRKQSEGEWKKMYDKAPRYVCTACNHLYNNKEYKYCPNCGAKMKGGAK